jgi:hypothetical protein
MSYAHDVITLRHGKVNDGAMRFSRLRRAPVTWGTGSARWRIAVRPG